MAEEASAHYLEVPGALLHYQVRGAGPVLLLVPGGLADGGMYDSVADRLAEQYTVINYDPRGISRSRVVDPSQDISVHTQAEDARQLLAAVGGDQPAYLFGSSGGGLTCLELAVRQPDRVRALVVHEPPVITLLPDAGEVRAAMLDVLDGLHSTGPDQAMARFLTVTGMAGDASTERTPPTRALLATFARMRGNIELFYERMMVPLTDYQPDLAALRTGRHRLGLAIGTATAGQLSYRTTLALAERLGIEVLAIRGGHGNFVNYPDEFCATLRGEFAEAAQR